MGMGKEVPFCDFELRTDVIGQLSEHARTGYQPLVIS